ncbi:MAG: hypothetical protein JO250_06665 [Armatimonadetes bacterium]|nr:hypothetical protein [Armatimonadota bacterium]
MKAEEKQRAREMRLQGHSYREILEQIPVSKGTLSLWLRDIFLTEEQQLRLKGARNAGREKFRVIMRAKRDQRWSQHHREAEEEFQHLRFDADFMFGLALYIGEGSKTKQNEVRITNCDPRVIQKGLQFFLKIGIPRENVRVAIHLHPGLSKDVAEGYWRKVTGLPESQFHMTRDAVSRASSGQKGNLQPYGTCQLRSNTTVIRQKLSAWMDLALTAR